MRSRLNTLVALLLPVLALATSQARAQDQEPRLALVIGNANYRQAPLATSVNDAGLIAQTLQAAGFDVSGAADLNQEALRHALRDFVAKVQQAGPNAVVFVYLAGRGLQYAGENYFVPVDAVVQRETDVPLANVRLTDYTRALAALPAKARIFVFDIARSLHFATEGNPFASGLALVDAGAGFPLCLQRRSRLDRAGRTWTLWLLCAGPGRNDAHGRTPRSSLRRHKAARE